MKTTIRLQHPSWKRPQAFGVPGIDDPNAKHRVTNRTTAFPFVNTRLPIVASAFVFLFCWQPVLTKADTEDREPEWQLVWSDEFDYEGLPDPSKWGYEEGFVRNNEAQYYTRARTENARVADGRLVIEARKEAYNEAEYTSASVTTRGTASWTYGRVEVRAKVPTGRGMWPAIWMLGTNISEVGWPDCGEIDIMEHVGYDPERIHGYVHTGAFNHTQGNQKGANLHVPESHAEFHTYAIEWFDDRIDFFVDEEKYFTFENTGGDADEWPFDRDHFLIIKAAVGGSWGGQQGIDDHIFPRKYLIDYVRVYQQED